MPRTYSLIDVSKWFKDFVGAQHLEFSQMPFNPKESMTNNYLMSATWKVQVPVDVSENYADVMVSTWEPKRVLF